MKDTGVITGVSVSHSRATVDEIEAAGGESVRATVSDLLAREGVEEAFALATCNRSEAYAVTTDASDGRAALAEFAPDVRDGAVRSMNHETALRHLMRVAAGLESLVLGEDQILGQVRDAYEESRGAGGVGPVLSDAVPKAIHVGERARTETAINEGAVSIGSAAVRLADREADLAAATGLVVGAGEMGTLAARALDDTGVDEVIVANRTVPTAEHIAEELDAAARAEPLSLLTTAVDEADVIVSATGSPEPVLGRGDLADAGPTVCIDVARPRDVDPSAGELAGVGVYDIDDLESVTERTRDARQAEAREVEAMIDVEFERLLESFKRKRADEVISAMYESAEAVKGREVGQAVSRLEAQGGLTDEQRETVESMADALVGQLLAAPTKSLREAAGEDDWTTIQTALQLFDPEFDDGPEIGDDAERMPEGVVED